SGLFRPGASDRCGSRRACSTRLMVSEPGYLRDASCLDSHWTPRRQRIERMTTPIFLSSGDVIADRRFEWARDRQAKGDLTGAADLMMQAIELVPAYAPAWFVLGALREMPGDRSGAIAAFEQALIADPGDRQGAALRLVRLGGGSGRARTEGYLRALFDGYAPEFDHALTSGFNIVRRNFSSTPLKQRMPTYE